MKDLKITPGEWRIEKSVDSHYEQNTYIISTPCNDEIITIWTSFLEEGEAETHAAIIADAGNTYQSTGMTASELAEHAKERHEAYVESNKDYLKVIEKSALMKSKLYIAEKQRDELLEALKGLTEHSPMSGSLSFEEAWRKAKAAIQSIEQNEKQK